MWTLFKTPYLRGNPLVIALVLVFVAIDQLRGWLRLNLGTFPTWYKRYYLGMIFYQFDEIEDAKWREARRAPLHRWALERLRVKWDRMVFRWYVFERTGRFKFIPVGGGVTRAAPISPLFYRKQLGGLPFISDASMFTGNIFFVDAGTDTGGTSAGFGQHPDRAVTDIDAAYDLCTATQGDVLIVLTGHAETITNSDRITLDTAGIDIIGLGRGTAKPTITHGTDATADVLVSAANMLWKNIRHVSAVDSLANFLDLDAGNFTCEDCDFVTASATEALTFVDIATTIDDFVFARCTFLQPTDPAGTDGGAGTGCIHWVDTENIRVEDCHFFGNFETAIFHNLTTAGKNLFVINCTGIQRLSGAEPFQLVDGQSGAMVGGGFITPAEAAATEATLVGTVGDSFFILPPGNFGNDGDAGGQGGIIIATAS